MMRRLILAAALLLTAAPGHAQQLRSMAPARVGQRDLRAAVDRLAAAWSHGDASGMVAQAAAGGIAVETSDGPMGPLPPRQAAAVLRRVFGKVETLSARTAQTAVTGGEPPRAYGEIEWIVRPRGASRPERTRVFVALVREGGQWRVTQIRLMQ